MAFQNAVTVLESEAAYLASGTPRRLAGLEQLIPATPSREDRSAHRDASRWSDGRDLGPGLAQIEEIHLSRIPAPTSRFLYRPAGWRILALCSSNVCSAKAARCCASR